MKPALAQTASVLRRLMLAIPEAWRGDIVFRWASVGAGACLLALLLNSGAKQMAALPAGSSLPPLPPPELATAPTANPPPVPARSSAPAATPPRIAPGRELNSSAIAPATPDADRFGTIPPRQ